MPRAHRVEVTEVALSPDGYDYASAFQVNLPAGDDRSAEQWARSTFDHAPPVIRWSVVFGWKYVMRFRLGSRSSPDHVSGWTIASGAADAVLLEVHSPLATAHKVVRLQGSQVVMTTFVLYRCRMGRMVWTAVMPIHHRTEPYLLGHAASLPG